MDQGMRRPSVSQVESWNRTFHQDNVAVYEASNYDDYFKVAVNGSRPKYFYGETAWMDAQRFALDNLPVLW